MHACSPTLSAHLQLWPHFLTASPPRNSRPITWPLPPRRYWRSRRQTCCHTGHRWPSPGHHRAAVIETHRQHRRAVTCMRHEAASSRHSEVHFLTSQDWCLLPLDSAHFKDSETETVALTQRHPHILRLRLSKALLSRQAKCCVTQTRTHTGKRRVSKPFLDRLALAWPDVPAAPFTASFKASQKTRK